MRGFVRDMASLSVVISNSLHLRGFMDKEVHIHQITDLSDREVMALLAPWRG